MIAGAAHDSFLEKSLVTPNEVENKIRRVLQNVNSERYTRKGRRDDTPAVLSRASTPVTGDSMGDETDQ